jgi:hypothetical protein
MKRESGNMFLMHLKAFGALRPLMLECFNPSLRARTEKYYWKISRRKSVCAEIILVFTTV